MNFDTAELFRRFENLIRIGTIADVDYQGKRLRVKSGELLTDWLPWPAEIGRNFKHWRPLRDNTQVVLACPSGDPAQALIISMLYSRRTKEKQKGVKAVISYISCWKPLFLSVLVVVW